MFVPIIVPFTERESKLKSVISLSELGASMGQAAKNRATRTQRQKTARYGPEPGLIRGGGYYEIWRYNLCNFTDFSPKSFMERIRGIECFWII
jgi:hypothetical protein